MYIYDRRPTGSSLMRGGSIAPPQPTNGYLRQTATLGLTGAPKRKPPAQEKKLVATITRALATMNDAKKSLKTEAQRDLLTAMLGMLSSFFPTGYGVIDKNGKTIWKSEKHPIDASIKHPGEPTSRPFRFELQLFLSYQGSDFAAGNHRQLLQLRSLITLFLGRLAGRSVNELGSVLVHEMVHMMVAFRQSLEARGGKGWGGVFPTNKAAALLDIARFASHRSILEQHFSTLLNYLHFNHGIAVRSPELDRAPAALLADMAVEEVLANVYRKQVSLAIAEAEAAKTAARTGRSAAAIATGFVPLQFLKNYLRHHWIKGLKESEALKTPGAERILKGMEIELLKLVKDMESHMAS